MLDKSIKTLMVDESETLKNLLPIICAKIGKRTVLNHEIDSSRFMSTERAHFVKTLITYVLCVHPCVFALLFRSDQF